MAPAIAKVVIESPDVRCADVNDRPTAVPNAVRRPEIAAAAIAPAITDFQSMPLSLMGATTLAMVLTSGQGKQSHYNDDQADKVNYAVHRAPPLRGLLFRFVA